MTIVESAQLFAVGEIVELFILDTTVLGGPIFHFTTTAYGDEPISFGGVLFSPIEIHTEGWEITSKGTLPTPKIKVSNVDRAAQAAVIAYGDLCGATVKRIRTLKEFLDQGSNPDGTAMFPPDVFKVDRKSGMDKNFIEWELAAAIDQEGRNLPARQALRDACTHSYRFWTGSAFSYVNVSCPYTGTVYFDELGNATANPAQDKCGKQLNDCIARFGQNSDLPTRAMPGVGRF